MFSTRKSLSVLTPILSAVVLSCFAMSDGAWARWHLGKIVNNSSQILTLNLPVNPGATLNATSTSGYSIQDRGALFIVLPENGVVNFVDAGHKTPCMHPEWAVTITFGHDTWGYYYDGEGVIDATISAQGTVSFTTSNGQIVPGGGPPGCQ
jgi:hypothetical protein